MENKREILYPKVRLLGGVKIYRKKVTSETESVIMPPPEEVTIPLCQHIGAPCEAKVKVGDEVKVGTLLGDSDVFMSVPVHSSVSGTVKEIAEKNVGGRPVQCVTITSDGKMTPYIEKEKKITVRSKKAVIQAARDSGLVGLGGAGFPTHVKLTVKDEIKIDTLIINGAECEPYITSDYRTAMEDYSDLLDGVYMLLKYMKYEKIVIAIEANKRTAIKKLFELVSDKKDKENRVLLMELKSRYPQGAERQLIYSVTGRKLGAGKLPSDVGCAIMNISSVAALYRYVRTGMPVTSRRITVDGAAIKEPKNVIVPIGTKVSEVIDFCGGFISEPEKILLGGPMMGRAIESTDEVITKPNNAIIALLGEEIPKPTACIKCGKCYSHCPVKLNPSAIEKSLKTKDKDTLTKLHPEFCIECGCCAFSCPAYRPLTQVMRTAKEFLREANKK